MTKEKSKNGLNGLSFKMKCRKCKKENLIIPDKVEKVKVKEMLFGKEDIYLMIYKCVHCGEIHYCQIDNDVTLRTLKNIEKVFIRTSLLKNKNANENLIKFEEKKYNKLIDTLTKERKRLKEQYAGKTFESSKGELYYVKEFIM